MNLVPYRKRVSSSIFRKLPNGAVYWLSLTSGPFVKLGSGLRITANVINQTNPHGTAVATNTNVMRQDRFFIREGS